MKQTNIPGVPITDRGGYMCLAKGRVFYPLDPRADEVFIEDIAQSLAHQIRYNGLSDKPVNIGQHSCQCSWLADVRGESDNVQLAALMHDAPEFIVGDMVRPIKINMPTFKKLELGIERVIGQRFNLPQIDHSIIKYYDNLSLSWEKRDMYASSELWPHMLPVPDWCPTMHTWTTDYTQHRFLSLFEWLMHETNRGHLL